MADQGTMRSFLTMLSPKGVSNNVLKEKVTNHKNVWANLLKKTKPIK